MHLTNRSFQDVETSRKFNLWMDSADNYYLIAGPTEKPEDCTEGTQVNGFFICAHTGVTIKLNGKKQVKLNQGQFYNMKEGETITHKKYTGFPKFTKC